MPKSRNRAAHAGKATHYATTLKQQREAQRRRDVRERLAGWRGANGMSLQAAESARGFVTAGAGDLTAFDTVKG